MRPLLRVAACATRQGRVRLRIQEQVHRGEAFGEAHRRGPDLGVGSYEATNGVLLCSDDAPSICNEDGRLRFFLQGRKASRDNDTVDVELEDFAKIQQAIHEYNHGAPGSIEYVQPPFSIQSSTTSATLGDAAGARSAAATRDALQHDRAAADLMKTSAVWDILLRLIKLDAASRAGREVRGMVRELANRLDHIEHEEVVQAAVAAFEDLLVEDPDRDAADALRDACGGRIRTAQADVFLRASPNQEAAGLAFGDSAESWSDLDRATYALRHDVEAETGDLDPYAAKTRLRDFLQRSPTELAKSLPAHEDEWTREALDLMVQEGYGAMEAWTIVAEAEPDEEE